MKSPDEIETMLCDVRASYRLLHDYQKLMLDTVQYISNSFGMRSQGGSPMFTNPRSNHGYWSPNNWSWDWLGIYHYHFAFLRDSDEQRLAVHIVTDTGFYDSQPTGQDIDQNAKRNLSGFNSVEKSRTLIGLVTSPNGDFTFLDSQKLDFHSLFGRDGLLLEAGRFAKFYEFHTMATRNQVDQNISDFIESAENKDIEISLPNRSDSNTS